MAKALEQKKRVYEANILEGCARTLWVMAYADFATSSGQCANCTLTISSDDEGRTWVDENGDAECPDNDGGPHERDSDFWPTAKDKGGDWNDAAPTTPAVAYACATALLEELAVSESAPIPDLFELAMTVHTGEPFQWYEDSDKPSEGKRREMDDKLEEAHEFGSGIAHEGLGSGVAWGDDHKTRRGNAVFEPKVPDTEFRIDDFDLVQWNVSRRGQVPRFGTDSIEVHVAIGHVQPIPEGGLTWGTMADVAETVDIDPDDLGGYDSTSEAVANALEESGGDSMEIVEEQPNRALFRATPANGVPLFLLLTGMTPEEIEWAGYLYTKAIGRIRIVNTPSGSDSYSYEARSHGIDGVSDGNILFWFGQVSPTLLLVFGSSVEDGLEECVDWIEKWAPGNFCDDSVQEEFERLVREKTGDATTPFKELVKTVDEEELWELQDEAAVDTTSCSDGNHYINSDEWGIHGENLSLAELREAGDVQPIRKNPHQARHMKVADIQRAVRQHDDARAPTVRVTRLPFARALPMPSKSPSAASRSRR